MSSVRGRTIPKNQRHYGGSPTSLFQTPNSAVEQGMYGPGRSLPQLPGSSVGMSEPAYQSWDKRTFGDLGEWHLRRRKVLHFRKQWKQFILCWEEKKSLWGEEPALPLLFSDCQPCRIPEKPCCARKRSSELKWLLLMLRGLGQLSES